MGHLGGLEVDLVAVEVVAAVKAIVEVAEGRAGELGSVALQAVGLDVATDAYLHWVLLGEVPPGGGGG